MLAMEDVPLKWVVVKDQPYYPVVVVCDTEEEALAALAIEIEEGSAYQLDPAVVYFGTVREVHRWDAPS